MFLGKDGLPSRELMSQKYPSQNNNNKYFLLLKINTLSIIGYFWSYRDATLWCNVDNLNWLLRYFQYPHPCGSPSEVIISTDYPIFD